MSESSSTAAGFFDAWSIYDSILDRNYMFHDEIYCALAEFLRTRFSAAAFRMLDLGCGSARHLAPALRGLPLLHYTGWDLSGTALAHARRNLTPLGCALDLRQGDLREALQPGHPRVDLVFSSFALHHLDTAGKARFFADSRARLAPGGLVVLIDTSLDPGQDRGPYVEQYVRWVREDWTALPAEAVREIEAHVRANDWPDTEAVLADLAARAGYGAPRRLCRHRWHGAWVFAPPD